MFTYYQRNEDSMCYDCGHDTQLMCEYYMVHEHIWLLIVFDKPATMLCIRCAEARLGREFTKDDFIPYPINMDPMIARSLLLRKRMSTTGAK